LPRFAIFASEVIMATMNVSLPDPMKDWVEAQAATGRYSNASDYVRDLIRSDQERVAKLAELQQLIAEGLESGVSDRSITEVLEAARRRVRNARDDTL
jgi:antitoxin ParD1/3/4